MVCLWLSFVSLIPAAALEMMESAPTANDGGPGRGAGGSKRAPGAKGSVARASRETILKKRKDDRKNRRKARRSKKR